MGVSALAALERGQLTPLTLSQRRKKRDTRIWEGIALKMEGRSVTVTAAECKVEGLEICGDKCVKQCCNAGKGCMFLSFQVGIWSNYANFTA